MSSFVSRKSLNTNRISKSKVPRKSRYSYKHQNRSTTKKKRSDKVENFLQQVKEATYYICTVRHRSLHQRSAILFKHEKYYIINAKVYHPVKSFHEHLYFW